MKKFEGERKIAVYRGDGTMYFSFRGERKVPKESPRKERTRVLSLRILSPVRRCLFALRQKGFMRYDFTGRRQAATSAERRARGTDLFAGMCEKFSSFFSAFWTRSVRTALRRSCGVSGVLDLPRNQTPSPLRWRRGRAATVGFLREALRPPLSGALLVLFSRQGEKSTQQTVR